MPLAYGKSYPKDLLAKAKRDLQRFETLENDGATAEAMGDALMDVSVALTSGKDWLKKLSASASSPSFTKAAVESFATTSQALKSFQDIANEYKHGGRGRDSTTDDVLLSAPSLFMGSGGPPMGPSTARLKIIPNDASRHRASDLGRAAIAEWQSFLQTHGLA
ncbi:MAG: hypothetical protein HP496_01200 [Nitrospira sp.]|nr:hypothetical protein [Nitrospira sp.]